MISEINMYRSGREDGDEEDEAVDGECVVAIRTRRIDEGGATGVNTKRGPWCRGGLSYFEKIMTQ